MWRYQRDRRVLWPLASVIVAGAIPGVWLGAWLRVRYLSDPARFKLLLGAVLAACCGGAALRYLLVPG